MSFSRSSMIFTMTEAEEVKTFEVDVYHMHSKYLQERYRRNVYGLGDICMVHLTEQVNIPEQVKGLFSLYYVNVKFSMIYLKPFEGHIACLPDASYDITSGTLFDPFR